MDIHPSVLQMAERIKKGEEHGSTVITTMVLRVLGKALSESNAIGPEEFYEESLESCRLILRARPAPVLLSNALQSLLHEIKKTKEMGIGVGELKGLVGTEAARVVEEINGSLVKMGEIGARRIREGDRVLTHAHSQSVLSVLRKAHEEGKSISVVVTETRPDLRGRLMARDLVKEGIPTTMIVDSAVYRLVDEIDRVLFGAEAVAANGAVVNKIGTATIASVAHQAGIRVFVAASVYKFSSETMFGELIEIEEREPSSVISDSELQSLGKVEVRNPDSDVTPPGLIDLIITENGVIPPQAAIMVLTERKGPLFSGYSLL